MKPAATAVADADRIDPQVWRIAAVVFIGPFMAQLDSTVVNVSLVTVRHDLHATTGAASWIISGYLLALALALPLTGWLVDRIGARRLYLGCFTLFTVASMLCGAARSLDQLILARLLQGVAGGLMAPLPQMMLARIAGRHMARVMGYMVAPILIAPILGPIVAGGILKYASWPWLFYLNLPVGILGVALGSLLLPAGDTALQRRPFDLPGFLLISPGLACLLYGLPNTTHPVGLASLLAGLLLLAAFGRHAARKGRAALIDLQLFRNRIFSAAAATQFASNGAMYARQFLVPLFLITGCALTASQAGGYIAALGIGMLCSFPMVGGLTERFGCRAVSAGGALLSLMAMLPFPWMAWTGFSPMVTLVTLLLMGLGQGTINIPSLSAAYAAVGQEQLAVAGTAINIVQRLGGPIATTVTAIVLSLTVPHGPAPGHRPFLLAFAFLIALQSITLAAAVRLPKRVHAGV